MDRLTFGALIVVLLAAAVVRLAASPVAGLVRNVSPDRSCESLGSLSLPNTAVTGVASVSAGGFSPPSGGGSAIFTKLPDFCRVSATLTPSSDSDIRIEVWMPVSGWNGKFQGVGNGGWNGAIAYAAMAEALERGYATSSTDTGHSGSSASFALGHPEKLKDYAHRAVHEMTVAAKRVIEAYYGDRPRLSYWRGCSAGGKQGLKEAQQYPYDYNGIIAGAPAADWTGRAAASMRVGNAVHKDEASFIPREKYALIHSAVLDACDGLDGVKDGVLENPRACHFDPKVLQCTGSDGSNCLSPAQVDAARVIYGSAAIPGREQEVSGLEPGSELGWATWGGAQPFAIGLDHFRYVVFRDPNWDYRQFSLEADTTRADAIDNGMINALEPNLGPFFGIGASKLLQYHGWSDPQISPGNSVQYYHRVARLERAVMPTSYRLFMVPGMAHCRGGDGTDTFDVLTALEQWVEKGIAPDRIDASRIRNGKIDRTRPLCPYPQIATYRGSGSTDAAASFDCKASGG